MIFLVKLHKHVNPSCEILSKFKPFKKLILEKKMKQKPAHLV